MSMWARTSESPSRRPDDRRRRLDPRSPPVAPASMRKDGTITIRGRNITIDGGGKVST